MNYKKFKVIVALTILIAGISTLGGCTVKDVPAPTTQEIPSDAYEVNIGASTLDLINDYLKDDTKTMDRLKLTKLNDQYFLASVKTEDIAKDIDGRYILVDEVNMVCKEIKFEGSLGRVKDINFQGDKIIFDFDGSNIINGFRVFPYKYIYNIKSEKSIKEESFIALSKPVTVGNYMNDIVVDNIHVKDMTMTFNFGLTEKTILAGGMFAPHTVTGYIHGEDLFYIDLLHVHDTEEIDGFIKELEKQEYINSVSYKTYEDSDKAPHLVLYFDLKNIEVYHCDYVGGDDGEIMEFELEFKRTGFTYENDKHDFSLYLPKAWKNKYKVVEKEKGVTFAYSGYQYEGGSYQNFFSISTMEKEDYEQALNNPMPGHALGERDGKVYVLYLPLDVGIEDLDKAAEYRRLFLSVDEVEERFKLEH